MMKVVGEEGTSLDDYLVYLKGEFLDAVYLQQNSFDPVDASVVPERQRRTFGLVAGSPRRAAPVQGQGRRPQLVLRAAPEVPGHERRGMEAAPFRDLEAALRNLLAEKRRRAPMRPRPAPHRGLE